MKTSSTFTLGILIACAIAIPWLIFCPFSPPWRFLIPVALCLVYLLVRSKKFALNHGDGGFSLIELLVVMAIIAILSARLVPAALKARKQADFNKAKAEMSSFASLESMIYLDTGGYVDLNDLDNTDTLAQMVKVFDLDASDGKAMKDLGTGVDYYFDGANSGWSGPYATFQPEDLDDGTQAGDTSYHTWTDANRVVRGDIAANGNEWGYPLDPWGNRYILAYLHNEKVMVIYSGGPTNRLDTIDINGEIDNMDKGSGKAGDNASGNDDLFYKFK